MYFSKDPIHRSYHHNHLTFSMLYAYSENFILPSPMTKSSTARARSCARCPGMTGETFANLRLLLGYMYTHPGKKLLFMGTEVAPDPGMGPDHSLDWHLEDNPRAAAFKPFWRIWAGCI